MKIDKYNTNHRALSAFNMRHWLAIMLRAIIKRLPNNGPFKLIHMIFWWIFNTVKPRIKYNYEWYDKVYHPYLSNGYNFEKYIAEWESKGYKKRFYEVWDNVKISDEPINWLEVACMQGKTAYWVLERYPKVQMYMFDFSQTAIDWVNQNFPQDFEWQAFVGDIQNIQYNNENLEDFFDVITCIDVTEHLPQQIYHNGISEMFRVLKPGGLLILMQGYIILPEHINILSETRLVSDFCSAGFNLIKHLPHRHHLLTKSQQPEIQKSLRKEL